MTDPPNLDVSISARAGSTPQGRRSVGRPAATTPPSGKQGPLRPADAGGLPIKGLSGVDLDLVEAVFALGGGLPVAELAVPGDRVTARAVAAALWMARLWGSQDGYACLCVGVGGHLAESGGYEFSRFTQCFHRWPAERHRLLAQAMATAGQADVYVGVLLRTRPSRRAGTAQPGPVAWADVDGPWTAQRARALGRLEGWPTWQVHSGTGRHVYLPLDDLEPPARLEGWNRRLAALLEADSGWSETKLLRLPGTYNHKPRAAGGRAVPVEWLW
jgi:hypothetical protein